MRELYKKWMAGASTPKLLALLLVRYNPGVRSTLLTVLVLALANFGAAQAPPAVAKAGPWFGLTLPGSTGTAPAVLVGARPPRPAEALAKADAPEFAGDSLKADVQTIVQFARDSRERREVGHGQMWGRIAGFPSSDKTVEWTADQFRNAGIKDVRIQPITQDTRSALWLPLSWQVKLLADPAFGPGTTDIVLESALPVGPSDIAGGTLTAPLVYVGAASPAVLNHIDVKGKIAVQLVVPQGHMLFERGAVEARSEDLVKRGAVGVFNIVRLPGNELSRYFSDCGGTGGPGAALWQARQHSGPHAGVRGQCRPPHAGH